MPNPILRQAAAAVNEVTDGTRQLLDDMAATMYDAPGIGLAAPQVNISQRVIVMDCSKDDGTGHDANEEDHRLRLIQR